ncbi:MAG: Tim44 domain-containing protein [Deltaproteobacteria bacterium]|nr:Tim44 domain-containing protein [Deltaproteobacteria bacterium]
MNKNFAKTVFLLAVLVFLSGMVLESDAFARIGGGRSFGSRGSRSYSVPSRSFSTPSPSRQQSPLSPGQPAPQQPGGGGLLRGLGGGILGGLLGGMLFSNLGFGGGFGGGGFGIVPILLVLGGGYLLYRMVAKKRVEESPYLQTSYSRGGDRAETPASYGKAEPLPMGAPMVSEGLSHLRQMDPSFDDSRFKDMVMDIFFRIQGAWMNRNLSSVGSLLTEEVKNIIQQDVDGLLREKKINRLENIAVRNVEISEVWQESGQDFITVLFTANLLDYTTDEATGGVVAGSKTEPVKFEEFWTFTRPLGNNPWRLSAINQA